MILKKGKCDDYLPGYHARRRMKNKIWTCLIILTIAAVNVSCNSETECKHIDSQVTSKEAQSKDFQSENFEKNVEDTEEYSGSDNPIDKYFTPKLKSWDISEVEFRENREAYKKAWKAEYKNVMKSLKKKCVYAEDKRNINSLEKNIEQQIKVEKKVLKTELTETYEINPDPSKVKNDFSRISLLGHGTRECLSQSEGEIYRDVCIRILNLYSGKYKFKFCAPKNEN